jgi:7 transmembrane receptor (rhodopsin family)
MSAQRQKELVYSCSTAAGFIQQVFFADRCDVMMRFSERYRDIMALYVIVPLCVVGFICNILISIVLGRDKTMNGATRFLLRMLALADIVFYVLFPICEVVKINITIMNRGDGRMDEFINHMGSLAAAALHRVTTQVSQTAACWLSVVITYMRYTAISRPLKARQYNTMRRARVAVAVVWIGTIIVYSLGAAISLVGAAMNLHDYLIILFRILLFVCIATAFWLPISLTVFFNIRMVIALRSSSVFCRQQLQSHESRFDKKNRRLTVMLIVIMIINLVCQTPTATNETVLLIVCVLGGTCSPKTNNLLLFLVGYSCLCLTVINSLADCVVYLLMGKRFRQILVRTLFCRKDNDEN